MPCRLVWRNMAYPADSIRVCSIQSPITQSKKLCCSVNLVYQHVAWQVCGSGRGRTIPFGYGPFVSHCPTFTPTRFRRRISIPESAGAPPPRDFPGLYKVKARWPRGQPQVQSRQNKRHCIALERSQRRVCSWFGEHTDIGYVGVMGCWDRRGLWHVHGCATTVEREKCCATLGGSIEGRTPSYPPIRCS